MSAGFARSARIPSNLAEIQSFQRFPVELCRRIGPSQNAELILDTTYLQNATNAKNYS